LLILASVVNTYVTFADAKGCWHEFGVLAIPPLQHFIYSKYFENPAFMVYPIAVCQNVIGSTLLFIKEENASLSSKKRLRAALVGALIFFFGIAPLGLMSGFPSSLVYASTMMLCWPKAQKLQVGENKQQDKDSHEEPERAAALAQKKFKKI